MGMRRYVYVCDCTYFMGCTEWICVMHCLKVSCLIVCMLVMQLIATRISFRYVVCN